mgnify:CR=1 FL=1
MALQLAKHSSSATIAKKLLIISNASDRQKQERKIFRLPFPRQSHILKKINEPKESFLFSRDQKLMREQLAEVPGMKEILVLYKEFHKAANGY